MQMVAWLQTFNGKEMELVLTGGLTVELLNQQDIEEMVKIKGGEIKEFKKARRGQGCSGRVRNEG